MVARSEDQPRSPSEKTRRTDERLAELARAQGRGAPALRDEAGNVLLMNADAPYPLLGPQGIDAAVAFTRDSKVRVTSSDTSEDRDFSARDLAARDVAVRTLAAAANVDALGASLGANGVFTPGPCNVGPIGTTLITCETTVRTADVAASHYIDDQLGNVRNGATYSRAGLKTEVTGFAERLDRRRCSDVIADLELVAFRYSDAAIAAGIGVPGPRTGFILEDLERAAPALVRYAGPDDRPHDGDYIGPQTLDEVRRAAAPPPQDTFSELDVRTLLLGAIQEKNAEITELRETIRDLAARVDALS